MRQRVLSTIAALLLLAGALPGASTVVAASPVVAPAPAAQILPMAVDRSVQTRTVDVAAAAAAAAHGAPRTAPVALPTLHAAAGGPASTHPLITVPAPVQASDNGDPNVADHPRQPAGPDRRRQRKQRRAGGPVRGRGRLRGRGDGQRADPHHRSAGHAADGHHGGRLLRWRRHRLRHRPRHLRQPAQALAGRARARELPGGRAGAGRLHRLRPLRLIRSARHLAGALAGLRPEPARPADHRHLDRQDRLRRRHLHARQRRQFGEQLPGHRASAR